MNMKSESEVAQSCRNLANPMDCSLPGSSVHGIFQARVLEWGAIAFSSRKLEIPKNFSCKDGHNKGQKWYGPNRSRRHWQPTLVLMPGKSHGQRSLVGCSPWDRKQSDTIERLHFHFSPSCVGEGNGNPLQCSCLENPRDREASWAAVSGVAQSWTRLM